MELTARRHRVWNPKTRQTETRTARTLYLWRFAAWAHSPDTPVWRVEIHVKDSPRVVMLTRHGLSHQNFDWSHHWHVCLRLGKVGVSYDGNSHRRQAWEMRHRFAW